jgi:RNA polymerase sigma factor (sigma-70 family)
MPESLGTRPSLLVRLRDPQDREAWQQFVNLYAPLIHKLARWRGFQDADAADVTQEVLTTVARTAPGFVYDPGRGSFRGWLYTVTCNKIRDIRQSRGNRERGSGDSLTQRILEEIPAPEDEAKQWERDYQRQLFAVAAEKVRDSFEQSTWQAFWLLSVLGKTGEEAAKTLGLSVGAVYVAKSRVLAQIKKQIEQLEPESI